MRSAGSSIAWLSRWIPLRAGDVIAWRTPAGFVTHNTGHVAFVAAPARALEVIDEGLMGGWLATDGEQLKTGRPARVALADHAGLLGGEELAEGGGIAGDGGHAGGRGVHHHAHPPGHARGHGDRAGGHPGRTLVRARQQRGEQEDAAHGHAGQSRPLKAGKGVTP